MGPLSVSVYKPEFEETNGDHSGTKDYGSDDLWRHIDSEVGSSSL